MSYNSSFSVIAALLIAGCLLPIDAAIAQVARPSLVAAAQPAASSDEPSFRDPKTGHVWTPSNVGQDGKPVSPADRAFDPNGQAVVRGQIVMQTARTAHVGTVPMLAGPTVPIVELDNEALRVRPGRKWRVTLYLQNNSTSTIAPVLFCHFTNGEKTVMWTEVSIPPTAGGERIGIFFTGPSSEQFLDLVTCSVLSP